MDKSSKITSSLSDNISSPPPEEKDTSQVATVASFAFKMFNTAISPFYWMAKNPGRVGLGIASISILSGLRSAPFNRFPMISAAVGICFGRLALTSPSSEEDIDLNAYAQPSNIEDSLNVLSLHDGRYMLEMIGRSHKCYPKASVDLQKSVKFNTKSYLISPDVMQYFSDEMKEKVKQKLDDKDFMIAEVARNPEAYLHASEGLKDDDDFNKEVALKSPKVVEHFRAEIKHEVEKLLDDEEFMLSKIAEGAGAYLSASDRLKADLLFNVEAGLANSAVSGYFDDELKRRVLEHIESGECKDQDQSAVTLLKNTLLNARASPTENDRVFESPKTGRKIWFPGEGGTGTPVQEDRKKKGGLKKPSLDV